MNIDFNNAEKMETGFTQTRFVIEKVIKNSTKELGLEPQSSVKLSISRGFSVDIEEENPSKVKMEAAIVLSLDVDGEDLEFLTVHAAFQFKIDKKHQKFVTDKAYQKLFAVQANVQLTDFVNSLLMNSELRGDRLSYEI